MKTKKPNKKDFATLGTYQLVVNKSAYLEKLEPYCDELEQVNKELLEALQETEKDLCVLWGQMIDIEKTNPKAEGLSNLIHLWRKRNKAAINKAL